ncbi:MAG: hypothetical protein EXR27_07765 [Betaproteobacteria bacterium]|nr:hypothetical protein [Betaproteobacteria bacterium]
MTELTVTLPDDVARQAQAAGLLHQDALAALLRDAMTRQRVGRLFATMDRLSALDPALSEAEIAAEIKAARAERRASIENRR